MTRDRLIPISTKHGIDPHMAFCRRCGGDADELTLGVLRVATLSNGAQFFYSRDDKRDVVKYCAEHGLECASTREVGPNEKVPAQSYCAACVTELNEHAAIVAAGGLYFKCDECKQEGVIKRSDFCDHIRTANQYPGSGKARRAV